MAKITLDPGEQFAHSHTVETNTILLAGEASLQMLGKEMVLTINEPVTVPPHTEHILIAKGTKTALLGCGLCIPPKK